MPNEHEQVMAMLGEVLRRIDLIATPLEAPLTRKEFAKRLGVSACTISRRIAAKKIRTEKGKIPYSELRKLLS